MWTLALIVALLAASWLAAYLPYRFREPAVPVRPLLVGLRTAALFLLGLLLWNPSLPGEAAAAGDEAVWVVVDGRLGMIAEHGEEGSAWTRAVDAARDLEAGGARVAFWDGDFRAVDGGALEGLEPTRPGSRLAPAVERAMEAGATRVHLLSDFRIADMERLAEASALFRSGLSFEGTGGTVRNAGIRAFDLPARVDAGDSLTAEVRLHGEGTEPGDSVTIEVRREGALVASRSVPAVGDAGTVSHTLDLPPLEGGLHRFTARVVLEGDGFPEDDVRVGYVRAEEETGIVLVSFEPDWEPRSLLPVLESATGLGGEGYLRMADGRYLPLRRGEEGAEAREEAEVLERLGEAHLVVAHGVGEGIPEGMAAAIAGAPRLLALINHRAGGELLGMPLEDARDGEWRVVPELPPSAVAGELAGLDLAGLPPLARVLPPAGENVPEPPLLLQRGSEGGPESPALLLVADEERRRALVLASGFWRWSARSGAPRDAYRRVWSATAGHLLRAEVAEAGAGGPESFVFPRGEDLSWRVPEGDRSVRLQVERAPDPDREEEEGEGVGETVLDTVVVADDEGRFSTPALPHGPYRYRLASEEEEDRELGSGRFDVERYAGDLSRRPVPPPEEGEGEVGPADDRTLERSGVPVRVHPLPYLLLLALLSVEWFGRRRAGLR